MKEYGGALRKLRKHFGFTQQQLAEKLNVSYQTVSKWETGTNQMDLDTVRLMCDVFGISLDAFIKVADGMTVNAALAPKPVDPPAQPTQSAPVSESAPTQPVAPPTPAEHTPAPVAAPQPALPRQPAPSQPVKPIQPAQPVTAPQPTQENNTSVAHKPIDKTALILALVLFAVILVFIIATVAVFAPRKSSGLDGYLNTQKGPTVTVSYNLGGGSPSMASEQFKNGVVKLPYCSAKRKGYKFNGWSYDGKVYDPYDTIKGITSSGITVTATWKPITYTISFGGFVGTGNMPSIKAEYGKEVKLPKSNFTLAGEPMLYWYADLNERYDDEDTVINLSDRDGDEVSLLPSWDPLNIYVKLNGNGGFGGDPNIWTYTDRPATVDDFGWYKEGHRLVGWKCGDRTFRMGETFEFNTYRYNYYTATAVWEKGTYYLRYKCSVPGCDGGGSVPDKFEYGSNYVLRNPCEGKHAGYEFVGIYSDSYSSNLQQPGEIPRILDDDSVYIYPTVSYKPIKCQTTIKCESDSGVKTYDDIYSWEYDTDIRQELTFSDGIRDVDIKTGYHISGYKIYINGTEYTGDMCKVTTDASAEIVVEILQESNSYTVMYYLDEYVFVDVLYDEEFTLPTPPPDTGYVFDGWKINNILYKVGEKISKLTTTDGKTVQATQSWTPITYTVQFFAGGGSGTMDPVTIKYDQEYSLPNGSFTKDEYDFIAWERDGELYPVGYKASKLSAEQDAVISYTAVWGAKYEGAGTAQSPYLIGTYEQLYNLHWFTAIGDNTYRQYALSADIDCDGKPLYPICGRFIKNTLYRKVHGFAGVFDGKKHVISNADFKAYELYGKEYVGLFGVLVGAKIYDLGIVGYTIDIQSANNTVTAAPLAAVAENNTSNNTMLAEVQISRVWTSGTICVGKSSGGYFGGFIGAFTGGKADDCFATGEINVTFDGSAMPRIGGFAAKAGGGQYLSVATPTISRCYADMDITATTDDEKGNAYVSGFIYTITSLKLNSSFVSGSATLSKGCVARKIGNIASSDDFNTDGNVYVRSDYTMNVNGEVYYGESEYKNTSAQNLYSAEWLTSELKFNTYQVWQATGDGLPTLNGFAGGNA